MRIFKWMCFALLMSLGAAYSAALADTRVVAPKKMWFTPSLTVDDDNEICQSVLQGVKDKFLTSEPLQVDPPRDGFSGLRMVLSSPYQHLEQERKFVKLGFPDPKQVLLTAPDGQHTYLYYTKNPGCGMACETTNAVITDHLYDEVKDKNADATPNATGWSIYETEKGHHYLMGSVDGQLETYRVAPHLQLVCSVTMIPDRKALEANKGADPTLKFLDAFNESTRQLSRPGGFCGSLHTDSRFAQNLDRLLWRILYRPWEGQLTPKFPSENAYGDYPRIIENLEKWSLGGLSEEFSFRHYKAQLEQTQHVLADFYVEKFGWTKGQSEKIAADNLKRAVAGGFGFYRYEPYAGKQEEELRTALLMHKPMSDIEAIDIDPESLNKVGVDSILNVAITYPDALNYLLKHGVDPNQANDFGKTPLMYAAQYNNLEAIHILLDAQANPNAQTTELLYGCGSLTTTGMTPLHYAVRYAGAEIIRLLIDRGADISAKSHRRRSAEETPLDWLRLYTSEQTEVEKNQFIKKAEIPELVKMLKPGNSKWVP